MNYLQIRRRLAVLEQQAGGSDLFPIQFIQRSKKTGEVLLLANCENIAPAPSGCAVFKNRNEFTEWIDRQTTDHEIHVLGDFLWNDFMEPNRFSTVDDYVNALVYVNGYFVEPTEKVKQIRKDKFK